MSRTKKARKSEDIAFYKEFVAPAISWLLASAEGWKPPDLPELTAEDLLYMSPEREEELHQQAIKMRNK